MKESKIDLVTTELTTELHNFAQSYGKSKWGSWESNN